MKRLFTTAILALAFGLAAFAQGLPKTEFQIIGFGGKSGINYTVDKSNFATSTHTGSIKSCDFGKPLDLPWGYGGGFGFVWNFAPHWGLVTGVEASYYKGEIKTAPDDIFQTGIFGTYDHDPNDPQMPVNIYDYLNVFEFNDFKETQEIWMAQVPLMLQFNAALNKRQGIHWYISAGVKLGYAAKATYSSSSKYGGAYELDDYGGGVYGIQPGNMPGEFEIARDRFVKVAQDENGYSFNVKDQKLDVRKFNVLGSVETGFRWKLGNGFGLYTGIYADYGILSLCKSKGKLVKDFSLGYTQTQQIEYTVGKVQSILTSERPDFWKVGELDPTGAPSVTLTTSDKAAASDQHLFSAGLKVRLSFGRHSPKPLPVVAPVKPDTVTVEKIVYLKDTVTVRETVVDTVTVDKVVTVKDTVTVEKVVRDTVVIIKEVPVEIQKVMKDLSNALFKFGSFKLGETEKGYLDTVADWIKSEPEISVEIGGHTDSVGSDSYNQKLSEQRAKAVHDYIVSQGVDASRLSYKGYGESEPIATNETEAGRQRNRRVELKILQ